MRLRRRYISTQPVAHTDNNFGGGLQTADPLALGSTLYLAFGMRVVSLTAAATAHQWGQWGTAGVQQSWGYSFHQGGFPRLAVYDGVNLLGGPVSPVAYEDTVGTLTLPAWLWVATYVELDIGGGNWRFTYWCGRHRGGLLPMGDPIVEASALGTFFNSTAALSSRGLVNSRVDRTVDLELRETPTGPLLVDPGITHEEPYHFSSALGGDGDWIGPDGRTWSTNTGFDGLTRSTVPRPCAA